MREQPSSPLHLAIDIGASSGRHILGRVEEGRLVMEEMHRFENRQLRKNGHDCWDMDNLWQGILEGLRACGRAGKIPATIGIDTWGVDFVLLSGQPHPGRGCGGGGPCQPPGIVCPHGHSEAEL